METAIVSLICIALVVFGGMTMSQGFLSSVDSTTAGMEATGQRNEEIMRTELSMVEASSDKDGNLIVVLSNSGQTKLADFNKWDVIVQYTADDGYYVKWLPYTSGTPAENEWAVEGIYIDESEGTGEVFEPNILNPGEEVRIEGLLRPEAAKDTFLQVVVSTPNGITVSTSFERDG